MQNECPVFYFGLFFMLVHFGTVVPFTLSLSLSLPLPPSSTSSLSAQMYLVNAVEKPLS